MRSATESKIGGVCGGIAEYMDADPTVVRLIWALCTFFTGIVLGVLAYIAAWIIMPLAPVYVQASAAPQASAQQSARPA